MGGTAPDTPWLAGSRAFWRPDGLSQFYDLGNIQPITVDRAGTQIPRRGSWGGNRVTLEERTVEATETLSIRGDDFSPPNLSFLFAANLPEEFTIAGTAVTDQAYTGVVANSLIKLFLADGTPVFQFGTVTVKNDDGAGSPGATLVLGTDYDIYDNGRTGLIVVLPGATITNGTWHITYTPAALADANAVREIKPATKTTQKGRVQALWAVDDFGAMWVREADATLAANAFNPNDQDFSDWEMTMTIDVDLLSSTPAGTLRQIRGTPNAYGTDT